MEARKSRAVRNSLYTLADGRWVDDDYYEQKAREDCLAKGFKPGDPHPEPQETPSSHADSKNQNQNQGPLTSADRASAVYKTGGPTTFFGGAGLGPFAGEMPSSRKAALGRDGVTEENWLLLMAQQVVESNALFSKMRRERLEGTGGGTTSAAAAAAAATTTSAEKAAGTVPPPGQNQAGTPLAPPAPGTPRPGTPAITKAPSGSVAQPVSSLPLAPVISTEGLSQSALRALRISAKRPADGSSGTIVPRKTKATKVAAADERVKGVYEAHTGLVHCAFYPISGLLLADLVPPLPDRADTQPTRSRMERVYDPESYEKSVLGGTLTGSGAWGLAWIDTVAEVRDYRKEKEEEMNRLFRSLTSKP